MTNTTATAKNTTATAKNADGKTLTSFQKIESLFKAETSTAFDVETASFQTQKTIFFPLLQLVTSIAGKAEKLNKETTTAKGKDLTALKVERNYRFLNEISKGRHIEDINILKRFRENIQKLVSFLVLDLTDEQTKKLIILGANQAIKRRATAQSQTTINAVYRKGYSVKIAVGKMTENGIKEKAESIRDLFESGTLDTSKLDAKQVSRFVALKDSNDDLSLVTFCKTYDVKKIKE